MIYFHIIVGNHYALYLNKLSSFTSHVVSCENLITVQQELSHFSVNIVTFPLSVHCVVYPVQIYWSDLTCPYIDIRWVIDNIKLNVFSFFLCSITLLSKKHSITVQYFWGQGNGMYNSYNVLFVSFHHLLNRWHKLKHTKYYKYIFPNDFHGNIFFSLLTLF